jgi:nucleotide-binding universal stress UspA family protein
MLNWLKILCAVDFSEGSRHALEHAAELARRFEAELTLIHVRAVERVAGSEILPSEKLLEEEARELGHKLEEWKTAAEQIVGRPVRTMLESGAPAPEIVRAAARDAFDLVVTGTKARRGLGRVLLGSVAERVVREAPVPVLVARRAPDRGD